MVVFRRTAAALGAIALLASTSVAASASIRPSDSLVSASAAAKSTPIVGRQGAEVKDANHISPALLILILLGLAAAGYALEQALSESP
ncbi:MAG: hypothetical protein V4574_17115 [Pseudomonadota bacterium]